MVIRITLVAVFLVGSIVRSGRDGTITNDSQSQDSRIKTMIEQLWSPEERVRLEAKRELQKTGLPAAASLMALLTRLADEMYQPHFATGKELEGKEALKDPNRYSNLTELNITWRLILDCTELLSQMKCGEAVPLLIHVMERRVSLSLFEKWHPEMYDLANMGALAVPALIESIKNASSTAASLAGVTTPGTTGANPWMIDRATRIRERAAIVLAEIGDIRALPTLKGLLLPGAPFEQGDPYIEAAIAELEKRR